MEEKAHGLLLAARWKNDHFQRTAKKVQCGSQNWSDGEAAYPNNGWKTDHVKRTAQDTMGVPKTGQMGEAR